MYTEAEGNIEPPRNKTFHAKRFQHTFKEAFSGAFVQACGVLTCVGMFVPVVCISGDKTV